MPIEPTVLKPRTWLLWLPLIISVTFLLTLKQGFTDSNSWTLIFPTIAMGVAFAAVISNQIIIDNEGITRRTLLGNKHISWAGVTRVYLTREFQGKSKHWFFNFETLYGHTKFSVGLYSNKSRQKLAESILIKCSHADIDPMIRDMAQGNFPSVL